MKKFTLENIDTIMGWYQQNPEKWNGFYLGEKVLKTYVERRETARSPEWIMAEKTWNSIYKVYNIHNKSMNFNQNEVKQIMDKVKSKSTEKPKSTNFFDDYIFPEKEWSIQTKIDFYRHKGYKVPNRLQPFIYTPELAETETPVKNNSIYNDGFWNNFTS
jgi:hypothetical protein